MPETANHIIASTTTDFPKQQNLEWITDDLCNVIVQAYHDGVAAGEKKAKRGNVDQYMKEYEVAKKMIEAYFTALWSASVKCREIRMKVGSPFCFDAIAIIPAKDYLGEGFGTALKISKSFVHPNSKYTLHYSFMPYSKKINNDELIADGFYTSYKFK
jgi:hypothetical protein